MLESRLNEGACDHLRTWLRFLSCGRLIENDFRSRLRREFNTTMPRFDLMAHVEKHPDGIKMSDLSQALMVTNGNLTGITDQLVKDGFIERFKLATDRRNSFLTLTAAGKAELAKINAAYNDWVCSIFGQLSDQSIQAMMGFLDELKAKAS